jgi:hypothetical protein
MKTKLLFLVFFMGIMISNSNISAYTKDPALCNGMKASWDATSRKFTISMLNPGIKEPWVAWVTDISWSSSSSYVDITPYDTFVPGSNTYTSSKLDVQYGDPTKGGINGASILSVAIKGANNNLPNRNPPTVTEAPEDCNQAFSFVKSNCTTPILH